MNRPQRSSMVILLGVGIFLENRILSSTLNFMKISLHFLYLRPKERFISKGIQSAIEDRFDVIAKDDSLAS